MDRRELLKILMVGILVGVFLGIVVSCKIEGEG